MMRQSKMFSGFMRSSDSVADLEQAAVDHRDDKQHVSVRHVSSGHVESRGRDANPVIRHRLLHLQKQQDVQSGKRIPSEHHVHGHQICSHLLWHLYPPMDEVKNSLSWYTGGNFPLITPMNTHLFRFTFVTINVLAKQPYLIRPNVSSNHVLDSRLPWVWNPSFCVKIHSCGTSVYLRYLFFKTFYFSYEYDCYYNAVKDDLVSFLHTWWL